LKNIERIGENSSNPLEIQGKGNLFGENY